jgi:AAA family ATP:ADP antiporter
MQSWALIDRRRGTGSLEAGTRLSNNSAAVASAAEHKQELTDKLLSAFAPVRRGEGVGALLLAAHVFLLLSSYYILKTVRESLILSEGGAEIKAYSSAAQATLLLLIIPSYSWLASKMKRDRLLTLVTLFFASHLGVFVALAKAGFHIGVAFFLWVGIFNLFVISQFWALANDLYDEEQGKRLLPVVGVGSSLGAWIGSVYAGRVFSTFGSSGLMLIAAGLLLGCIAIHSALNRFPHSFRKDGQAIGQKPLNKDGAFRLILNSRYLFWIAILVLVVNVVNTTGEFLLSKLVVNEADRMAVTGMISAEQKAEFIGEFYGSFFSWVNLAGMVFQLFLVSRLFKFIGVRGALFVLPSIALVAYGLVAVAPLLALVRIAKIFENGTDYSIQNTARQALFLVTSREAKYKAKAAIDSFFWRIGDVLAAALVFVGTRLQFGIRTYATFNIALAVVWIFVVLIIGHEHKKLSAAA